METPLKSAVEQRWGHWEASLALENTLNQFYYAPLGGVYLGQRPMSYGILLPGPGHSVNI